MHHPLRPVEENDVHLVLKNEALVPTATVRFHDLSHFFTLHTPLPIPQLKRKFRIEKGYSELGDGDFEAKMQFFHWLDSNLKIASLNQSQPRMACCCLSSVDDYDA